MKLDHFRGSIIGDKIFTNGPSKNLWSKAFKKIELIWSAKIDHLASIFFKDCIPQILLGPFLNTLFNNWIVKRDGKHYSEHNKTTSGKLKRF